MNTCPICNKKGIKRLDTHMRNAHSKKQQQCHFDVRCSSAVAVGKRKFCESDIMESAAHLFRGVRYVSVEARNLQADGSNLLFVYNGSEQWVDLSATMLNLKLKVSKKDGSSVGASPTVYPIQAVHSTMWDRIQVEVNSTYVDYPTQPQYINYLNLLLGTSQEVKSTTLKAIGYMTIAERKAMIKDSRVANFFGPFMSDLFLQQQCGGLLPPQTDMRISLNAAPPEFVLTNTDSDVADYKFEVVDVEILFKLMDPKDITPLNRDVDLAIARRLITVNSILKGQQHFTRQDLTGGRELPNRVFLAFVKSKALLGDKTLDPFELKNYNIKSISLTKSGVEIMGPPYFPVDSMVREYISLSEVMGLNGMTLKEFDTGSTVFAFQILTDSNKNGNGNGNGNGKNGNGKNGNGNGNGGASENGDLSLNIEFNAPTRENLEMIVLCEYGDQVTITPSKEVIIH